MSVCQEMPLPKLLGNVKNIDKLKFKKITDK